MQTQKQYRQGDVLLAEVSNAIGAIQPQQDRVVLVRGQATGNTHSLSGDGVTTYVDGERTFVQLAKDNRLTHQEHGPIDIPAGTYEVMRKREYTPEAVQFVED